MKRNFQYGQEGSNLLGYLECENNISGTKEIIMKYTTDILAIQETRQTDNFIKEVGNYKFFNSGDVDRKLGTEFM
ncbi:hypothetical protein HHI36_001881, partial [Cryptolaemus montrouzieri]